MYTVSAELKGFKKYVNEKVTIYAQDIHRLDIDLEVANVAETVTVKEKASVINTEEVAISTAIPKEAQE